MKSLALLLTFSLLALVGNTQGVMERKGCFGLESSVYINQNNKKSLCSNIGVSLTLDFKKLRVGGLMNFVMVKKPDKVLRGAFAPAFEYTLGYRLVQFSENDLHFGLRGGIRTGVFKFEEYNNTGDIYTVPELQSTSYLGPALSLTRYYHPSFIRGAYLQFNFEVNYMFALNAYNSDDRVFDYKIDKKQALLGNALHLKLQIGWGKGI
ncbi:hypothetical protein SAMN05216474_1792 [Lishizhenia tianjinensis]|uniref:Uncharacterized protein n=1 Tax=Lishizhenia tianjinensis TaxID=477690 RepID=A0A1I7A0Q5_9FLAO|nr:hypothetical protein [Lishizhenia tianjinensis]SFT68477.1 hypothetical protein SAMN05216474_1792 [Lishizhenia tianjinensis]